MAWASNQASGLPTHPLKNTIQAVVEDDVIYEAVVHRLQHNTLEDEFATLSSSEHEKLATDAHGARFEAILAQLEALRATWNKGDVVEDGEKGEGARAPPAQRRLYSGGEETFMSTNSLQGLQQQHALHKPSGDELGNEISAMPHPANISTTSSITPAATPRRNIGDATPGRVSQAGMSRYVKEQLQAQQIQLSTAIEDIWKLSHTLLNEYRSFCQARDRSMREVQTGLALRDTQTQENEQLRERLAASTDLVYSLQARLAAVEEILQRERDGKNGSNAIALLTERNAALKQQIVSLKRGQESIQGNEDKPSSAATTSHPYQVNYSIARGNEVSSSSSRYSTIPSRGKARPVDVTNYLRSSSFEEDVPRLDIQNESTSNTYRTDMKSPRRKASPSVKPFSNFCIGKPNERPVSSRGTRVGSHSRNRGSQSARYYLNTDGDTDGYFSTTITRRYSESGTCKNNSQSPALTSLKGVSITPQSHTSQQIGHTGKKPNTEHNEVWRPKSARPSSTAKQLERQKMKFMTSRLHSRPASAAPARTPDTEHHIDSNAFGVRHGKDFHIPIRDLRIMSNAVR